jgi:hypothetical protein
MSRFKVHYRTTQLGWTSLSADSADEARQLVEDSRATDPRILATEILNVEQEAENTNPFGVPS